MPVEITPLLPSDHTDWLRLWGLYQEFYEVCIPDDVRAATWKRLLDPAEPLWGALARDGASAIGLVHHIRHRTCWDVADSCYLQDLYVDGLARGQGVATMLIEHVRVQASAFGAKNIHWLTHESNDRAKRLYDHVATRSGFIQYRLPI